MNNSGLFSLLLVLIVINTFCATFLKLRRHNLPFRVGDLKMEANDVLATLVAVDIAALAVDWYLLRFQPAALSSRPVAYLLIVVITLLVAALLALLGSVFKSLQISRLLTRQTRLQVLQLALKNILGSGFRSLAIFLAVMGVAGFLLATTLVIAGARNSLDSGIKRLGADILVVPAGAETSVESALLMGKPTDVWMPRSNLTQVAQVGGVQAVSPQVYLKSLYGAACCAVSEMFIVVYDPATDFTLAPWLQKNLGRGLAKGEVIGGTHVFVPEGEQYIRLYGSNLTLKGNLEATGTGIDQTLFMTLDTAQTLAAASVSLAEQPLSVDAGQISTIMVKVTPGADIHRVALQIMRDTTGMVPIESPNLFGTFRSQMNGLLWGFLAITLAVWALAMVLIGLVFSMAANERRREMAVLRAIGATRNFIFRSVLSEAALLAISGAVSGIAAASIGLYLFKDMISENLQMPFLFPSIGSFLGLFIGGVALAIVTVTLAALIPAFRLSRQELAIAMRE